MLNPELLECKYEAKMMLETSMNHVLDASIQRIDEDLERIVNSIATLKVLVNTPDHQILRFLIMDLLLTKENVEYSI